VGDIIAVSGFEQLHIGDTLCPPEVVEPLPFVRISEPTIAVTFRVNDSPFAGRDGKYVTSRHLRQRLYRETLTDVSLRVEDTESTDAFKVSGRGELHISVLIENMRRQGYEFAVSKPVVLFKEIGGKICEPIERLLVDVPAAHMGSVMESLGERRATVGNVVSGDRVRIEFSAPSRGLFGYRNEFMTLTRARASCPPCSTANGAHARRDLNAASPEALSPMRRASRSATACSTRRTAGSCSSPRARRSTRAWWSAKTPGRATSRSTSARRSR
jgi:predicted membrane GTPase involved in stress response